MLDGWKRAMKEKGLKIHNDFIGIGDFKIESGYKIMKKMLENEKRPKALLAANNKIAYGAIRAIREKGFTVPDDIYVVCVDATDDTGLMSIHPPSIIQPAEKIGEIALDIIIKRLNNKEFKIFDRVILEPTFVNGL